jgi:hypothetical protein
MLTYGELHALSTGSPEFSADNNLATLGTALHDETEHTVACSPHSKTIEKLVAQRLALCDGRETTVLNFGGVEGDGVFGELEALLDEGSELADAASLLAEDFLGVGCADDNVGDCRRDADLDAGVALLGEFTLEKFVEFGVEHTVCGGYVSCESSRLIMCEMSNIQSTRAQSLPKQQFEPLNSSSSSDDPFMRNKGQPYLLRTSFASSCELLASGIESDRALHVHSSAGGGHIDGYGVLVFAPLGGHLSLCRVVDLVARKVTNVQSPWISIVEAKPRRSRHYLPPVCLRVEF